MSEPCRCGRYDGTGPHLCHGSANGTEPYTCPNAGDVRFYVPSMDFSLAGAQMKVVAAKTFACAECWSALLTRRSAT